MIPRFARFAVLLALLTVAFGLSDAKADEQDTAWRTTGGPVAFVTHLASDPTTPDFLIIFVAHGVYRNNDRTQAAVGQLQQAWAPYFSTDGGNQWQPASNDLAHVEPTVLTITEGVYNNTVWVGTTEHGLWRSENGGRTWRPALVKGLENEAIIALTVDARKRLHMVTMDNARYPSSHLYSSDDNGYNWSHRLLNVYSGDPATTVQSLIADPFAANRLYATTFGGLLVSDDAGFTWQQSPVPAPDSAVSSNETVLALDPTQRGRLYLAIRSIDTEGDDQINIHRSLDSAQSWETLPASFDAPAGSNDQASLRPLQLRLDPLNRSQLFMPTNNGLWSSTDGGMTWSIAGNSLEGVSVSDIFSHPQQRGRWIAIGAGGIWRTANAGTRWSDIDDGLPPASHLRDILPLATTPETLLALNGGVMPVQSGHQPLWRSTNGGVNWMPSMLGLEDINLLELIAHPTDPLTAFGLSINGVARTDDGGRTWVHETLPVTPRSLVIDPKSDLVFLATTNGVWQSDDRGTTWQETSLTDPARAVAITAAGDVLAVTDTGDVHPIWRSSDAGKTWTQVGESPADAIDRLIAHPHKDNTLVMTIQWGGLYTSNNGGQSWFRRDQGHPPWRALARCRANDARWT